MEFRPYIEGSPKVSVIGFGAWQLGNNADWRGMTEGEAIELVQKAIDEGVNFFDTAPRYGYGKSEELLGKALKNIRRDSLVINTKFGHHSDGHTDFSGQALRASIEGSLKRLSTDYLDSVLLHNPPSELLEAEGNAIYEILEQLKKEGKILAYGASLDTKEDMITFINHTKGQVIEAFFNILHQDVRFAFDLAKKKGIRIIAKVPLDSGWLTGKYHQDSVFEGVRSRWTREDILTRADLVDQLRNKPVKGQALAQFALLYCLAYDEVATVIPGAANIDQLAMNVEALKFCMEKSTVQWLEAFYETEVVPKNLVW